MNRFFAHFFSIAGHPLLIIPYGLVLLLLTNPYAFGVRHIGDPKAMILMISVFTTACLIPAAGIAMMRPLGLVSSLELPEKQDRIGPYIITGVFYLWLYKNLLGTGQAPAIFGVSVLGAVIALFLDFLINNFTKISAHATGMGGFVATVVLVAVRWPDYRLGIPAFGGTVQIAMIWVLAAVILLAGLVGTARLALGAHTPADLYRGYGVGLVSILVAQYVAG